MNERPILDDLRDQLTVSVHEHGRNIPRVEPLPISPWLAMLLMQKAIRRSRQDLALAGAATLLRCSPDRLWRRLCVTAYEDIGVGCFETVGLTTVALTGKAWRHNLGGDWTVASTLVRLMCLAPKCRAADDLAYICVCDPVLEPARLDLTFLTVPELLREVRSASSLPLRALALWYANGTDRYRAPDLRERKGQPGAVFDALSESGYPDSVVEVCRMGFKKCGEILPPFVMLLWQELQRSAGATEPEPLTEDEMVGPVPCWAYDMHVREGNRAMALFLQSGCETARWLSTHVEPGRRVRTLGEMLFKVESGLVAKRFHWPAGDQLRAKADGLVEGLDARCVMEGLQLLRADLPRLNEARRHVAQSNLR